MDTMEIIKQFISNELISDGSGSNLSHTDLLIESGIIDSFGIMALLSFLEEKFSIQILGNELMPENFESIVTLSALIAKKKSQNLEA